MKPQDSIKKAHRVLISKGICAIDGSGEPNVEGLFIRLSVAKNELKRLNSPELKYLETA